MLNRIIRKRFGQIYSWGYNKHNCGYEVNNSNTGNYPNQIFEEQKDIVKAVSGYSESLVLSKSGKCYSYGLDLFLTKNNQFPAPVHEIPENIIDCDIDRSHAIFLSKDGKIYETCEKKKIKKQILENALMVRCGYNFSGAIVQNGKNQELFLWTQPEFSSSEFIFCDESPTKEPQTIDMVNKIIKENGKIRKFQIVKESLGILFENGKLFTWGSNAQGNLGINRSFLETIQIWEMKPKEPMQYLKGFKGKVKDFNMSENILTIFDGEKGYYCGLNKSFVLKEIQLPKGEKVKSVGAFFNNFAVVSNNGKVFMKEGLEEDEDVMYYGNEEIYEISQELFQNGKVSNIWGKYQNPQMTID